MNQQNFSKARKFRLGSLLISLLTAFLSVALILNLDSNLFGGRVIGTVVPIPASTSDLTGTAIAHPIMLTSIWYEAAAEGMSGPMIDLAAGATAAELRIQSLETRVAVIYPAGTPVPDLVLQVELLKHDLDSTRTSIQNTNNTLIAAIIGILVAVIAIALGGIAPVLASLIQRNATSQSLPINQPSEKNKDETKPKESDQPNT